VNRREDTWISGLRLEDWDIQPPPKLAALSQIKGCLRKGEALPGNVCEVWSLQDVEQIEMLWQTFNDPGPLTLILLGQAQKHPGVLFTRLNVTRGGLGAKIENVALFQVGSTKAPWTQKQTKFEEKDVPKVERTTIRVCAPKNFREPYLPENVIGDSPTVIIQTLSQMGSGSVSDLFGGRWNHEQRGSLEQIVGFLRIKPSLAASLINTSGKYGIFVSQVGGPKVLSSQPFWIQRNVGESDDSYLGRVLNLQQTRNQPTIFRFGNGSSLGFPRKSDDVSNSTKRLMCMHGIPGAWHLEEVQMILSSQKWETVENLNRKGRAWFFTGSPPPDASKQTYWRYNMGKNKNGHEWYIEVQVASRPQKAPNQRPLKDPNSGSIKRVFGDFLSPTGNVSTETPKPKSKGRGKGFSQAAQTPVSSAQQAGQPDEMETGEAATSPNSRASRSPRRKEKSDQLVPPTVPDPPSPDATQHTQKKAKSNSPKSFYPPIDPEDAKSKNWAWIDLGGNGDCFYRCFSYFIVKDPEALTPERAAKEASFMRVKMVEYLRKRQRKYMELFPSEGDFANWVNDSLKATCWADGKSIQAISEKFGRAIVIWSFKDGTWTRLTVAPKFSKGMACAAVDSVPITLVLKDKHYQVLKPPWDGRCPTNWLRETPNVVVDLSGAGKRIVNPKSLAQ
jgi:hypothetical protein